MDTHTDQHRSKDYRIESVQPWTGAEQNRAWDRFESVHVLKKELLENLFMLQVIAV